MDINWRWTIFMVLVIVTQITMTQNIDNNWNQIYKKQNIVQSRKISDNNNSNLNTLDISETKNKIDNLKTYSTTIQLNDEIKEQSEKQTTNSSYKNSDSDKSETDKPHSRKKRLIWVTDDGRLALPPGTSLSISPTIALPFVRYPPEGFFSNLTISLPITIDFDKLGLTDNQNPLGIIPPYLGRSMGRAAGTVLGQYLSQYLHSRKKRETTEKQTEHKINGNFKIISEKIEEENIPKLPIEHKDAFHGGERAMLYSVIEDFLHTFGLDGKACLLRAICETHSKPVHQLGLIGEMLKLFLTASKSPFSELLDEYVTAERIGKGIHGPSECFPYYKECPKSLFKLQKNRYHYESEDQSTSEKNIDDENIDNFLNEIHDPVVM